MITYHFLVLIILVQRFIRGVIREGLDGCTAFAQPLRHPLVTVRGQLVGREPAVGERVQVQAFDAAPLVQQRSQNLLRAEVDGQVKDCPTSPHFLRKNHTVSVTNLSSIESAIFTFVSIGGNSPAGAAFNFVWLTILNLLQMFTKTCSIYSNARVSYESSADRLS